MPETLEFAIHTLVEKRLDLSFSMANTEMMRPVGPRMTPKSS